jgi:hypothetical protein
VQKRARSWSKWLWAAIIVAAVAAMLWAAAVELKPSGRENLRIEVAGLRSRAAVGRLLAEQAATGNLTANFFREHSSQLEKNVDAANARIDPSKFEPELRGDVFKAGELSSRLSADVRALEGAYGDGAKAGALKEEFADIFSQLSALEDSLKS